MGIAFHESLTLYRVISDFFLRSLGFAAQLKYFGLPFGSDRKTDSAVFLLFFLNFPLSFCSPVSSTHCRSPFVHRGDRACGGLSWFVRRARRISLALSCREMSLTAIFA
jgi:hypothetical protein